MFWGCFDASGHEGLAVTEGAINCALRKCKCLAISFCPEAQRTWDPKDMLIEDKQQQVA